jgi:hypothetical protein
MTITELIRQGLYYARRCKSLWLFGFFVGIASGGSNGGGRGTGGDGVAGGGLPFGLSPAEIAPIVIGLVILAVAAFILRFISEGALIEGIVRERQGRTMTTREGFRAGWAHWGVLLRIALLYIAATVGSLIVLAAPCVIAIRTAGPVAGAIVGFATLLVAIPWLVSLYLVQAFAARIAVLENRHALDAIHKARLFLHGRILHGLKLVVASFVGTFIIGIVGAVAIVSMVLLLFALTYVLSVFPVLVIGGLVLLPVIYVLVAMIGTLRSSIWTIGYVTQVES